MSDVLGLLTLKPGQTRRIWIGEDTNENFRKAEKRVWRLASYYRKRGLTTNFFKIHRVRDDAPRLEYSIKK